MGLASAAAKQARRLAELPEDWERQCRAFPVPGPGDAVGLLEYRDFRTGEVKRWTVIHGDRIDQVRLRAPDGRCSGSHGWTWALARIRGWICHRREGAAG